MSSQAYIFNPTERTLAAAGDGFSCPRLTTTGRTALTLTTGDKGMMVYDTTLDNLFIWNGTSWESVPASGDAGANGAVQYNDNGIVSGATNFVYDKVTGNVGVGTALPGGSISNAVKILAGIFSTLIGNTGSIATATPTTMFAAPSESTLIVTAYITNSSAPANFNAVSIVKVSGGVAAITNLSTALTLTITLSGADVQVTQATGVNQTVQFNVLRLA